METNIIVIGAGADYLKYMWKDSISNFGVRFVDFDYPNKKNFLYKICCSKKINLFFKTPIFLFRKFNFSFSNFLEKKRFNLVIFTDLIPAFFDYNFQKKLKKEFPVEFVFMFQNEIRTIFGNHRREIGLFLDKLQSKYIYSFDLDNCTNFNMRHFTGIYPFFKLPTNKKEDIDFLYIGKAKHRKEEIEKVFLNLSKKGFHCEFIINDVNNHCKLVKGIKYNFPVTYQKYLEYVMRTKCIVEINDPLQVGVTLRYLEALSFRKKLLTNNLNVKKEKFYNSDTMKIIENENFEKMDFSFIDNDYKSNYNGEYSSSNFLTSLMKEIIQ